MSPAPPKPEVEVAPRLGRWASTSNLRRGCEEALAITAASAAAGLTGVGLRRLPTTATHFGMDLTPWSGALGVLAYALIAVVIVAMSTRAWLRYRRRRTDASVLARRLDTHHVNDDLFTTALAVERGRVHGNAGLEALVCSRARTALGSVRAPIDGFEAPARALAAVGLAAAIVALLPTEAAADPDPLRETADEQVVTAPPLPEDVLEALRTRAKELERLEYTPALTDDAREAIREARERLEALQDNPDRSLSELARAQKALEDLERTSRERGLHDLRKLQAMKDADLAEQLTRAMQRGETDTAAQMAKELSRRLEDASPGEQDRIGRALERARRRNPAKADPELSRAESEARARDRNRLDELSESLSNGESGSSRADLDRLAEQMRRRGGSDSVEESLGDAAEEIRKARERQLDEMNGPDEGEGQQGEGQQGEGQQGEGQQGEGQQGEGQPGEGQQGPPQPGGDPKGGGQAPGEGEGEGQGKGLAPGGGEGEPSDEAPRIASPFGRPSGEPGPGGGEGAADTKGTVQPSTEASGLAPERVATRPSGPATGSVRAIRRYSEGYRDTRDYKDLHDEYSAVAESAVRREEIPLTRRDYIRSYFQAVRGR